MRERLFRNVGEKFWKGPDLVTLEDVIVYRYTNVPIVVAPNSLPPLHGLPPEVLSGVVRASVRSRYAQLGINLHDDIGGQIAQRIVENDKQALDGSIKEQFEARALTFNHCARPIFIPRGAHLFRFFYEFVQSMVRGKDLISLVESGEIKVNGTYGFDWTWSYSEKGKDTENNIVGMQIRIKTEGRRWIPPDLDNKPLVLDLAYDPTGYDYRKRIDTMLEPIPYDEREKLWVGETVPINLGPSVEAILDKVVVRDIEGFDIETLGLQTNSRLIDGGKTHWPIRVEVLSATTPERIPHYVHLHFLKNGH